MSKTNIIQETNIAIPTVISPSSNASDNYPMAPSMVTSNEEQESNSLLSLQLTIQSSEEEEEGGPNKLIVSTENKSIVYYHYHEPPQTSLQNDFNKELLLLYDNQKKPLWTLTNRDWHGMSLKQDDQVTTVLSTTGPHFSFSLKSRMYYWQINLQDDTFKLKCYYDNKCVAEVIVDDNLFTLFDQDQSPLLQRQRQQQPQHHTNNPFRRLLLNDPFTTLIVLTGLLVQSLVKSLLKSLGGNKEALQAVLMKEDHKQKDGDGNEDYDDIASLSSNNNASHYYNAGHYPGHYPGHQNLVDSNINHEAAGRWSTQSFKSIELDPGFLHCWFGYKFWWSWFPCCMPGGYFERTHVKLRNQTRVITSMNSGSRTFSKKGWQQQRY